MSPELLALINEHVARLHRLVADHRDLVAELASREPSLIEREALGTALHSFYTGIEFILRAIAEGLGGRVEKTGAWHAALLESMRTASAPSPGASLLSNPTADRLRDYLLFRHRFRNIYGSELDWMLMKPLVLGLEATLDAFESDLNQFLNT